MKSDDLTLLDEAVRLAREFLSTDTPVCRRLEPAALRDALQLELPAQPQPTSAVIDAMARYLQHSVRTHSPLFINQLFGGSDPAGIAGEILAAATNASMYTYEVAPAGTLIEQVLIERMLASAGLTGGGGQFVTGGSNANMLAMLCARQRVQPEVTVLGLSGAPPLRAFISAEAHYSFAKAAAVLGLGTQNLIRVPTDADGRMSLCDLRKAVAVARADNALPFFLAATAGTTVKGAIDPLPELAEFATQNNLWFHVDGAFGGSLLLSPTQHPLLQGIEHADSVTWDPHKLLSMPLVSATILTRQPTVLRDVCDVGRADYLFHEETASGACDLGHASLQCGRRVDALKLWLAWQHHGDQGFADRIDRFFALAAYAEARVADSAHLELACPRQTLMVCFRLRGDTDGSRTVAVRNRLQREGSCMINYADVNGSPAARLVTVNAALAEHTIDTVLEMFRET